MVDMLYAEIPEAKRREIRSAVGHHVSGILSLEQLHSIVSDMERSEIFQVGDPIQSLKGSLKGTVTRLRPDGRVEFKTPNGLTSIGDPDTFVKDN